MKGIEFCSLASGSSGNSQLIRSAKTILLLDAGLTGKYITNALSHLNIDPSLIDGMLITHEHSDHIKGIGIMHRKYKVPIYVHPHTWQVIKDKLGKIDGQKVHFIEENKPFQIKDLWISPIEIAHDAVKPLAYTFENDLVKLGIATDLGHVSEGLLAAIKTCDLLMLEANHNVEMLMTGAYPYPLKRRVASDHGHLSNEDCALAALEAIQRGRVRSVLLGHLSRENNTPDLAYETVKGMFHEQGLLVGEDVQLDLTYRDRMGKSYRLR